MQWFNYFADNCSVTIYTNILICTTSIALLLIDSAIYAQA